MARTGAQNAVMGDNFGTELPEAQIDETVLNQEKRKARYAKSKDYQDLKQRFQDRITFYQTFLPDGRPLTGVDTQERAHMWVVANALIGEFNMIFSDYENLVEVVAEADGK